MFWWWDSSSGALGSNPSLPFLSGPLSSEVSPVSWRCRIPDCISAEEENSSNECPLYDTKQSDGEAPVMLELWEMQSTPLLPSLPGPLWPGVIAPIYGPNRTKLCTYGKLNCLKENCFLYKMDLALNNLQWLMCHKTKPNQTKYWSAHTC